MTAADRLVAPCAMSRLSLDLAARRAVFGPDPTVRVPADGLAFWRRYAEFIRCGRPVEIVAGPTDTVYGPADRGPALWYSGGVESTYTKTVLDARGITPTLLRIEDFSLFDGVNRRIGQIHFLCAAIASSLGYGPIYLGMERNDLLLGATAFTRSYVERHPMFADWWCGYQSRHPVVTVCGELHKEEIIRFLQERSIAITGTCDRLRGGKWCGDCYKCFEAFYTAKAVGIDLGIPLARAAFDRYHKEYRRYIDSGFIDNVNNAYQHYVRLQMSYGLEFDRQTDCQTDAT